MCTTSSATYGYVDSYRTKNQAKEACDVHNGPGIKCVLQ
ncbi:MAG: hypothetical protein JWO32_2942 [Bacteroidetes bacterium]|nr:hypothetical protein [Bacteroidota bacterium]